MVLQLRPWWLSLLAEELALQSGSEVQDAIPEVNSCLRAGWHCAVAPESPHEQWELPGWQDVVDTDLTVAPASGELEVLTEYHPLAG